MTRQRGRGHDRAARLLGSIHRPRRLSAVGGAGDVVAGVIAGDDDIIDWLEQM